MAALNFPAKIYQILENESSDIIRWHANGCAFRITDHGRFEREIIPKYFRHNQLSSVQRQLNLYGFKCISRGEDKGAFYHPRFRRGDWEIVKKITRYAPQKKSGEGLPFYDGGSNKIPSATDGSSTSTDVNNNSTSFIGTGSNATYSLPKPAFMPSQPQATYNNTNAYRAQPFQFLEASTKTTPWSWDPSMNHHHSSFGMDFHPQHAYMYSNPTYQPADALSVPSNSQMASITMPSNASDSGMSVEQDTPRTSAANNGAIQKPPFVQVNSNHVVTVNPYFDVDAELDMFFEHDIPSHRTVHQDHHQQLSTIPASIADGIHMSSTPAPLPVKVERCEIGVNTDLSQAAGNLQELYNSCGDLVSLPSILQGHDEDAEK